MALGNPLLATYSADSVVRTYELVGDVFVPIGVSSAYPHVPGTMAVAAGDTQMPLHWLNEDDNIFLYHAPATNANNLVSLDKFGAQVVSYPATTGTNTGGVPTAWYRDLNGVLAKIRDTVNQLLLFEFAGGVSSRTANLGNTALGNLRMIDASESGALIAVARLSGIPLLFKRTSAAGVWPLTISSAINIVIDMTPTSVRFMAGDKVMVAADANQLVVYGFDSASNAFVRNQVLEKPTGTVFKILRFDNGRKLAVSFLNAGVYTTRIYKLASGLLVPMQDIAGFGQDLTASADGVLLVDPVMRKARRDTGTSFVDFNYAMDNIPTGVAFGKLSLAPYTKSATSRVYVNAVQGVGQKTIDFNNLKFTLLDSTATFVDTDATIATVTNNGAKEVKGGAWPAGGVSVPNVTAGMSGKDFLFSAPQFVHQTALVSPITWRYGVLYDATSGKPLIFFDYYGERTVATNRELRFSFPANVFLGLGK